MTIKRCFFEQIKSGVKKIEYREIKPYWETRIDGRGITALELRAGYSPTAPRLTVAVERIEKHEKYGQYWIHLGSIAGN